MRPRCSVLTGGCDFSGFEDCICCPPFEQIEMSSREPSAIVLHDIPCMRGIIHAALPLIETTVPLPLSRFLTALACPVTSTTTLLPPSVDFRLLILHVKLRVYEPPYAVESGRAHLEPPRDHRFLPLPGHRPGGAGRRAQRRLDHPQLARGRAAVFRHRFLRADYRRDGSQYDFSGARAAAQRAARQFYQRSYARVEDPRGVDPAASGNLAAAGTSGETEAR